MASPFLRPASAAGPPAVTSLTSAPLGSLSPRLAAVSSSMFWILTPSQPRLTEPPDLSYVTTSEAVLAGMAKAMPTLPPDGL
jgi:hypothetical protein